MGSGGIIACLEVSGVISCFLFHQTGAFWDACSIQPVLEGKEPAKSS